MRCFRFSSTKAMISANLRMNGFDFYVSPKIIWCDEFRVFMNIRNLLSFAGNLSAHQSYCWLKIRACQSVRIFFSRDSKSTWRDGWQFIMVWSFLPLLTMLPHSCHHAQRYVWSTWLSIGWIYISTSLSIAWWWDASLSIAWWWDSRWSIAWWWVSTCLSRGSNRMRRFSVCWWWCLVLSKCRCRRSTC